MSEGLFDRRSGAPKGQGCCAAGAATSRILRAEVLALARSLPDRPTRWPASLESRTDLCSCCMGITYIHHTDAAQTDAAQTEANQTEANG